MKQETKLEIIEIRIKDTENTWENTPVLTRAEVENTLDADKICNAIAKAIKKQVRWNYIWSSQGHYLPSKYFLETFD